MQKSRSRGRLKAPNISPVSLGNSVSSQSSPHPHPHQVARVFITMTEISAVSMDIIRGRENSRLSPITLDRVSTLSKALWEEILLLPPSTIPPLQKTLKIYELILTDIQRILGSNNSLEPSLDDMIDRRLDDFLLQFQEALDRLKDTISPQSSPNSTHFFQNSHHILISGGNFSTTSNPVVHDPVLREESRKIRQMLYTIQCSVLFS